MHVVACQLASIALITVIAIPGLAAGNDPAPPSMAAMRIEKTVLVPMRDGTRLSLNLYMPADNVGRLPAILLRTPYDKHRDPGFYDARMAMVGRGYVVVVEDMRGRHESEGRFRPGVADRDDGYDTVSWIVAQPWSDGKVGTMGCSYLGETQVELAAARHPNHLAAAPFASSTGYRAVGRPWEAFDGGVFELAETAGWLSEFGSEVVYQPPAWIDRTEWFRSDASKLFRQTPQRSPEYFSHLWDLPIVSILKNAGAPPTAYEDWVSSNPDGDYFRKLDFATATDTFDAPMLFADSWYDYGPGDTLELWNNARRNSTSARARDNQFVIIAPTTHCVYSTARGAEHWTAGERDLGTAGLDFVDLQMRWYDHWLKGVDNGVTSMPRVQYFLMGRNEWRHSDTWPLANTHYTKFYLHSGGAANSRYGDGSMSLQAPGREPQDRFTYDPATPVLSIGGQACCTGLETGAGAYDQSKTEMRHDVLVYTSDALQKGLEVTGPLEVVLFVSSSAKDTDFIAKLVDVYPDGRAFNVQEGALRMRYREGFAKNLRMKAGEVYPVRLGLHVTSNYFGPGHRVRLEVSSSSFPRFDRNLNTGGRNFDESQWVIADNAVHHSAQYPSHVLLPLIDQP